MWKIRLSILVALHLLIFFSVPKAECLEQSGHIQILETSSDGLVMRYQLPELQVDTKEVDGQTYQLISFDKCSFTHQIGKARVPVRVISLGIPDVSEPVVSAQALKTSLQAGYRLYPVAKPVIYRDTGDLSSDVRHSAGSEFAIDAKFYQKYDFYPAGLSEIKPMGYVRQQRIARLEIHPVQYNPATGQLRIYREIEIRVKFNNPASLAPSANYHPQTSTAKDSRAFEDMYQSMILNYEQARNWRRRRVRGSNTAMAPGVSAASSLNPGEQGTWYKISIKNNSIYRLDYRYLVKSGIDPEDIDPRRITLMSSGAQIPIYVEGYEDGRFDPDDYIEFYGVKMDSYYTDTNVYWLGWDSPGTSDTRSSLMPVKDGKPTTPNLTPPTAFWDTEHWEEDVIYDPLKDVTSEIADHLFWAQMRGDDPIEANHYKYIELDLPYRANIARKMCKVRVCFHGVTYARGASLHTVDVILNGEILGTAEWEGQTEYIFEVTMPQENLRRLNHFNLDCRDANNTYEKVMNDPRYTGPEWDVFLNWIEIDYWREFRAPSNRIEFSTETVPPVTKTVQYSISEFTGPNVEVFQIDRAGAIAKIINPETNRQDNTYTVTFQDRVLQPTRYFVINSAISLAPPSMIKDKSSTLHDPANRADYIMITHRNFMESTERLAEFRRRQGLDVIVVDVEDIYDEFSYGIFDPKAIKRFLRYTYYNWDIIPTYVLLMGDAHWDYKYVKHQYYVKYDTYPLIYVPTYHAPSSPYGESAVDHRFVTVSGDDMLPDMFIGRIPAESADEANDVVSKIISYESRPYLGEWQARIMLAADDDKSKSGDEVFETSRVHLADNVIPVSYEVAEIYLRLIEEPYIAENMIVKEFNKGVVIAEYSGHGGAHHWAHEGIFQVNDLDRINNYNRYPFVITTTCENGYFDNPMSKSIMESFLEKPRGGAIACLSATRLTYGQGNAAFDKILYPKIFEQKPPVLGRIMTEAKIDFINLDMAAWIGSAEQYTLFGDPATKLALPELEIDCELASTVVDPTRPIKLNPGTVKRLRINPATGKEEYVTDTMFDADMRISAVYPNNLDDDTSNDIAVQSRTKEISNGRFDSVSLSIPISAIPGEGRLRCYANDGQSSAIGGVLFSISRPVIEFYTSRIINEEFLQIYAAIIDNYGDSGIESVICEWKNSETWQTHYSEMELGNPPANAPDAEGSWYALSEIMPLSKPGTYIDFKIAVTDSESTEPVVSAVERVRVPIGVNLAISRTGNSLLPQISYSYSSESGSWVLSAFVENNGGKTVREPIGMYFFDGSPDRNRDNVVDVNANLLGTAILEYVDIPEGVDPGVNKWRPDEELLQVAEVAVELSEPLYSGSHRIFAWLNPKVGNIHAIPGVSTVEDAERSDDKASRLFEINEFAIGRQDEPAVVQSLDRTLSMEIMPDSVDETVMSITKLAPPESGWEQPDISPAPMPEQDADSGAFEVQLASGVTSLKKPARISIRFDASEVYNMAKEEKGLAHKDDIDLSETEKEWIELAANEIANRLGIFVWEEEIGVWKYVSSEVVPSRRTLVDEEQMIPFQQEPYVTLPSVRNQSKLDFTTRNVIVDEIITPIGEWCIFFISEDTYRVYLRREGMTTYERLSHGKLDETYYSDEVGLTLNIGSEIDEFGFGEIFKFSTYQNVDGIIRLADLRNGNLGDGSARISILEDGSYRNLEYPVGKWSIFFTAPKFYEIQNTYGNTIKDSLGYPFVGEVDKELIVPNLGVRISVYEGRWQFKFGDRITFRTLSTGIVEAEIEELQTMALMHNTDQAPPDIQVWIDKKVPQDGIVVAPRPDISLLLSDANGIDIKSLKFDVSVNDRDFIPVPPDDYIFSERVKSSSFVTNVPIFYSPVLNIGKYRYRMGVSDFNGNSSNSDSGDYLEFMFLVEEKPDMEPPELNITMADGQPLTDGHVFNESSLELHISIHDEYALDPSTISFSLGVSGELLEPMDESDYEISLSDGLKDAEITYKNHLLMNGEYVIQAQATDTSQNTGYLNSSDAGTIKFIVDEEFEVSRVINSPNPFSKDTIFTYSLTQPVDRVIIKIYTLRGRLVRTLVQDSPSWLYNEDLWDGRDEDGINLASGVYLYKFIVEDTKKKVERIGKLAIVR